MKVYIVYNGSGEEVTVIRAKSHNDAERKAKSIYGELASVAYTEN